MSDTVRCPGCGYENPAGSESCSSCNFPLTAAPAAPQPPPAPEAPVVVRRVRPIRPRRPRPADNMSIALWLMFGVFAAAAVVAVAIQGFRKNNTVPVEGSSQEQQQAADQLRAVLAKDSTNVEARIELANLLYDTGNWSDAIVNYRSAVAKDSTRIHAIVDMGVCYFNLSNADEAERMFKLALQYDPRQAVALFNLGIVYQQRGDHKTALDYFHRALVSNPPQDMKNALMDAMKRSVDASGGKAQPLPPGK